MDEARGIDDALRDEVRAERSDSLAGPDGPEGHELAATIGVNLRTHRTAHGRSLADLAARTGLDVGDVEHIERGEALPSLRLVWTLATAVGAPFGALLAPADAEESRFVVRRVATARSIVSGDGRFRSRPLAPAGHVRAPEVYELTLAPGCVEEALPHAEGTYEHMTVVRGTLVVHAGEHETRLGPGDALFFRADVPHRYENPDREDTVVHLVMTYA
jgi:transcriptional regulator with XRE-family HTH domain